MQPRGAVTVEVATEELGAIPRVEPVVIERPRSASRNRLRPGVLSSTVAAALVAVSVIGFALTLHSADQQEAALLQSQADQAATYASSALSGYFGSLDSVAAVVTLTDGSPTAFDRVAKVPAPLATVLAKKTGSHFTVRAETGAGFRPREVLTGDALRTVKKAGADLIAGPAHYNGHGLATVLFAIGPPDTPAGLVILEQVKLDPFTITPLTAGRAFDDLHAVLYGGTRVDPGDLVVATTRQTHLMGAMATAPVTIGASTWLLVATARHPLIGGVAEASPYIILVLGLLMAIVVGAALEVVQRRNRYANSLVEVRTAELSRSLEHLRTAQEAVVRSERLAAVGEMATIVGHELRNPLAAVMNALYLIRAELRGPVSDVLSRNLSMAETEAHKAATLADDLTAFVRPREIEPSSIDPADLVDEVLAATPPPPGIDVALDVQSFTLTADRGQLAEIVTNLVVNAYQALEGGGRVRIGVHQEGGNARIVVEDDGPGIPDSVAGRLFDPFVTTKYNGTGLGLAIVQRIVSAHGGAVSTESLPAGGTRFTVLLPLDVMAVTR